MTEDGRERGGLRTALLEELVMDVLGPRGGLCEEMKTSPLAEYITGILAPAGGSFLEPDSGAGTGAAVSPEESEEDVEGAGEDIGVSPALAPPLDPRRIPSSFGLSFLVEATRDGGPLPGDICITWARYFEDEKEGQRIWKRNPRWVVCEEISLDRNQELWFAWREGKKRAEEVGRGSGEAEISLHVFSRKRDERRYLVGIYVVNRIASSKEGASAEEHIFQPQIRVACGDGARIVPGDDDFSPADGDEHEPGEPEELRFLYRKRRALARGFLCSAVWKELDPQKYSEPFPPFRWVDGDLLHEVQPEYHERFRLPDVRTEFVPVHLIPFPDLEWPGDRYGPPPELRAGELAEAFSPEKLREALCPLPEGYRKWLEEKWDEAGRLCPDERHIAERLLERCRVVLERMEKGLEVLEKDEDARLAFCFANRAMDLQSEWSRKSGLIWRPFQLGYILLVLESIARPDSEYRKVCDLLWVPTGAGKTEAYLFLVVFTIALRRRRALKEGKTQAGVAVITRYTLRLLTIQQFRRALSAITACEYLRVHGLGEKDGRIGWRPRESGVQGDYIWGSEPFSAGLWVGGGVTPNRLRATWGNGEIPGAIDILKGKRGEGEPAQVIRCPACGALLAIPDEGIPESARLHLVVRTDMSGEDLENVLGSVCTTGTGNEPAVKDPAVTPHGVSGYFTLSLTLSFPGQRIRPEHARRVRERIEEKVSSAGRSIELCAARESRPGYFIRWYRGEKGSRQEYDFDIFCPAPGCPLRRPWVAGAPLGRIYGSGADPCSPKSGIPETMTGIRVPGFGDGNEFVEVPEPFRFRGSRDTSERGSPYISDRIPVPALTVDEQVYHRLPSLVVSTVDKFARPPFEPRAAALFGNVDHHHCVWGYYREGAPPLSAPGGDESHPGPLGRNQGQRNYRGIVPPPPPELILQDELHLIEGPLGSLVGFYETAVDHLCSQDGRIAKYIASTATTRGAEGQVRAVFARGFLVFPPPALEAGDRFFVREPGSVSLLDDDRPGRLYAGICTPGRGPQSPLVRIYARLLQTVLDYQDFFDRETLSSFWTLVGYFNAIRELGGARALLRQDVRERLMNIASAPSGFRGIEAGEGSVMELSGRTGSTELPVALDVLSREYSGNPEKPGIPDVLLTTSLFGTGVDIPRLSLMVVNGQPKTTSAYIQATGRVGRRRGALVVTFLRASRPRDLNHYEFFCGYHLQLHRHVEPATVCPFSEETLRRFSGPLAVFLLRNMRQPAIPWHRDESACRMGSANQTASVRHSDEVKKVRQIIQERAENQPPLQRPERRDVENLVDSGLDRWQATARRLARCGTPDQNRNCEKCLLYVEYVTGRGPEKPVVLGDLHHRYRGLEVVYESVPQSLRDIEETCGFQV